MKTTPEVYSCTQVSTSPIAVLAVSLLLLQTVIAAPRIGILQRDILLDKIRGGWAGQMIGVAYGAPTEFRSNGKLLDWDLQWKRGMLENTLHQDDLYVEMTFAKVMDEIGLEATTEQYGDAFKNSQYQLWHANAGARRALNQGIKAPLSGHPKYNFHANDIDFQIEADFIGLMCPGLPQESNRYCNRVGRVMNYGDGLYGGMFVCGMYSAAYFSDNPRDVVETGLACIPAKSQYALLIEDLLRWSAEYPGDWKHVWQLVQDKWDQNDPCPDGFQTPFNIDAKINGAYIAFGLLFGNMDFENTVEISTRCGQDSDCNPSSAAGVLGVMLGYKQIPERFRTEIPDFADKTFDYTDYSFNDIVASTEKRAITRILATGGQVTDNHVAINIQEPKAPKLEQWSPGIPSQRILVDQTAWNWPPNWSSDSGWKSTSQPGLETTLQFNGVAIAVLGRLNQKGGRADVYLDGKKQKLGIDAYIVPNTHDNVLWQAYDLKPGDHTLRIVTLNSADPRSAGNEIAISQAVTYVPAR